MIEIPHDLVFNWDQSGIQLRLALNCFITIDGNETIVAFNVNVNFRMF